MNNYKVLLYMERFWMIVALAAAAYTGWLLFEGDTEQAKVPIFVTIVAVILHILRRYQRKRQQPHS
jgi:membrane protein implicated in regulation of membrane protease activity